MTDVEPEILGLILKFVYEGEVDVDGDGLGKFMAACKKLELRGLSIEEHEALVEEGLVIRRGAPAYPLVAAALPVEAQNVTGPKKPVKRRAPDKSDHEYFTKNVPSEPQKRGRKKKVLATTDAPMVRFYWYP
jgi:hypothetical protein